MIKKLALLAAAAVLYTAVPTGSASAQGINVQIGGGGYHHHDRGYHRGHGYRNSRAYMRPHHHRGWDRRGSRTKIIVR